jgi:hypothetical protein
MSLNLKYPVITEAELQELLTEELDVSSQPPNIFDSLCGKTINSLYIEKKDNTNLIFAASDVFQSDERYFTFAVVGGCCSESWFADFFGLNSLLHCIVKAVVVIDLDEVYTCDVERERQYHDKVYGYKFITDKGTAVLSFRNSSNGYYGGDCYYCGFCSEKPDKNHFELLSISAEGVWQSEQC